MRIDLHTHSAASDGTDAPADLVRQAAAEGLDIVALTDHDTTRGWDEARAALPGGLVLLPGAEISCSHEGTSLHLLAYLFDPTDTALLAELERTRIDRVDRAHLMVDALAAAGYDISWPQVRALAPGSATVGRPHIADALVESGAVATRDDAFSHLLHNRSPFFVGHHAPSPTDAVQLVRAAGGVSVFAHPGAFRRGRVVDESVVSEMAHAGMAGLEVAHRDHDVQTRQRLTALASDLGLFVTGGSDYHGAGKQNQIGEELTTPEVFEAIVALGRGSSPVAA